MNHVLIAVPLVWFVIAAFFFAKVAVCGSVHDTAVRLGKIIPPFMVVTGLIISFSLPLPTSWPISPVHFVHHVAIAVLGLFLFCSASLMRELSLRVSQQPQSLTEIRRVCVRWATLTELLPAGAAISIAWSGFRMVWENPSVTPANCLSLFCVDAILGAFIADGILWYQPVVRRVLAQARLAEEKNDPIPVKLEALLPIRQRVGLWIHNLSFPLVIVLPFFKQSPVNPGSTVTDMVVRFFPKLQGNPQLLVLTVSISIFLAFGGAVAIVRLIFGRKGLD